MEELVKILKEKFAKENEKKLCSDFDRAYSLGKAYTYLEIIDEILNLTDEESK